MNLFAASVLVGTLMLVPVGAGSHAVDYQIHSNNDLLEWPQLLLKGARRFKVDPHFVPSQQCEALDIFSEDGCFLLNHDRPIVKFNKLYNSSDDLLSLLSDVTSSPLFDNPADKLTIALCFKDAPDKCSDESPQFQSWLRLVDDLYAKAAASIDPELVEFVLDGDGKPVDCLVGRWEKWNSVWINTGGPQEAFYSNSDENDFYRFQVLNDPENVANWTWMASADVDYGKFSESQYPYQLWEPDAQEDILEYIDIYRSGAEHGPGFHFAINIDIAMFELYAKNATGRAINQPLTGTNGASTPLIAPFPSPDKDFCSIATYVLSPFTAAYSVLCPQGDGAFPTALDMPKQADLSDEASEWLLGNGKYSLKAAAVASIGESANTLLLLADAGSFVLLSVSTADYGAGFARKGSFATERSEIFFDAQIGSCEILGNSLGVVGDLAARISSASSLCAATLSSGAGSAELTARLYEVASDNTAATAVVLMEKSIPLPGPSPAGGIASARIAALSSSSAAVFCAVDGTVYGSTLSKSEDATYRWVALSVGREISVSVSKGVLMLVTDLGCCFNSHKHNTRAYPTVCSTTPLPSDTVLDYSIGLLTDWTHALENSNCVYEESSGVVCTEISPCHDRILHGSYDQGSHPAVSLSHKESSDSTEYFFLEVHRGVPASEISALLGEPWVHNSLATEMVEVEAFQKDNGCGIPLANDGLVGDSFDISDWIRALKK